MNIKQFIFNMLEVNCYVLWDDTREAVVIDAGMISRREQEQFDQFISQHDLHITHLLNTHLHFDHIFGNPYMQAAYGVTPEAGADDLFLLGNAESDLQRTGLSIRGNQPTPTKCYANGDTITFGHTTLHVLHVPGHSPGSLAFYCEEAKCVFSGDALFKGSIGRTDLDRGNHDTLVQALHDRLMTLPDDTAVYPGHGEPTTIGYEKQYNPFL